MLPFQVQILGCGSSTPTLRHNPSAQIVRAHNRLFLFDCGEGTQRELRRHSIAMSHLQHIFITHLHGDHWFGLPGLLSTLALLGCRNTIYIHAFSELEKMLAPILHFHLQEDGMRVEFVAISPKGGEVVYEDKEFTITTLALHHRVPCVAYVCREKMALPHIRRDMIDFLKIPHYAIKDIKEGAGWQTADGIFYPHERLVTPA
ncbi:MAG: MBL fold metallo-hydrolase, partial [Bacteroidaceae bacterium]|nr:MBL fold metallo-hydrolase [Bacteroidaceae bacterium]